MSPLRPQLQTSGPGSRDLPDLARPTLAISAGLFLAYQIGAVITPYFAVAERLGDVAAGFTTAAFMLSATVPPLMLAPILLRAGVGRSLLLSAALLGPPTVLFLVWRNVWGAVALSTVRGTGFGIAALATGAVMALVATGQHQGEILGRYGLVTSLTAVVGQAGGLWFEHLVGFRVTFLMLAVLPVLASIWLVPLLRAEGELRQVAATVDGSMGGQWVGRVLAPTCGFACVAAVYGGLVTFAPAYLHRVNSLTEVLFFASLSTAVPLARLGAGVGLDRGWAPQTIILVAVGLAAGGMVALGRPPALLLTTLAGFLFGTGFGTLSTQLHVALVRGSGMSRIPLATAVFGAAWNAGMGIGGLIFGPLVRSMGEGDAFLIASLFCVLVVVTAPAWGSAMQTPEPVRPRGVVPVAREHGDG